MTEACAWDESNEGEGGKEGKGVVRSLKRRVDYVACYVVSYFT